MRKQVVDVLSPNLAYKGGDGETSTPAHQGGMDRAVALGYIDYKPAGDAINGAVTKMPRVRAHHRALPYQELPAALEAVRDPLSAPQ